MPCPSLLATCLALVLFSSLVACTKGTDQRSFGGISSPGVRPSTNSNSSQDPQIPPRTIFCKHTGSDGVVGMNTFTFSAGDCGGDLPNEDYRGFLLHYWVGLGSYRYRVHQPGVNGTFTPSVSFEVVNIGQGYGYDIEVVYVHEDHEEEASPDLILCQRVSNRSAGGYFETTFTAAECGGHLPDASYRGAPTAFEIDGANQGMIAYEVFQPTSSSTPRLGYWVRTDSFGGQHNVSVLFLKGSSRVCTKTQGTSLGINTVTFAAANCEGGQLPDYSTHFMVPSTLMIYGGFTTMGMRQPLTGHDDPSLYIWAIFRNNGTSRVATVSFPLGR